MDDNFSSSSEYEIPKISPKKMKKPEEDTHSDGPGLVLNGNNLSKVNLASSEIGYKTCTPTNSLSMYLRNTKTAGESRVIERLQELRRDKNKSIDESRSNKFSFLQSTKNLNQALSCYNDNSRSPVTSSDGSNE